MRLPPESPALENLRQIEQAASRAADLAKQMLAYSGKGQFVVEPLDLNRLVEEMAHMLQVSISKKAVLRYNFAQPLPAVEADATQMRQIIMNLVINASEAIGERSGVIAVTTGCMDCDRSTCRSSGSTRSCPRGSTSPSRSPTPAAAWTRRPWRGSSTPSSPPSSPAAASAWPPCSASSAATGARSRSTASRDRARPSRSSCPRAASSR